MSQWLGSIDYSENNRRALRTKTLDQIDLALLRRQDTSSWDQTCMELVADAPPESRRRETYVALPLTGEFFTMPVDNYEYFKARVKAEREAASLAPTLRIADIHEQLAEFYQALVDEIEARPPLRLVGSASKIEQPPQPVARDEPPEASANG